MPIQLRLSACLLGIALGGFFDGILFHQILQWHHLLSLWTPGRDLAFQVAWDGWFHAAHYAVAAAALCILWRRRAASAAAGAGPIIAGWAAIGFGAWHLLDVTLNHWLLAMHRARVDVPNPLAYDMIFVALGLLGLALGGLLLRRPGGGGGSPVAAGLAALLLVSAPVSAMPPRQQDPVVAALLGNRLLPGFCADWTRLAPQGPAR